MKLKIIPTLLLSFALAGCATVFGDNGRTVQVNSTPAGADVLVNGVNAGTTPTTIAINSTFSPPSILVRKPGYQEQTAQINTQFQTIGILNIFCLIPGFAIDAISGNMMKISPESKSINVNLQKN